MDEGWSKLWRCSLDGASAASDPSLAYSGTNAGGSRSPAAPRASQDGGTATDHGALQQSAHDADAEHGEAYVGPGEFDIAIAWFGGAGPMMPVAGCGVQDLVAVHSVHDG